MDVIRSSVQGLVRQLPVPVHDLAVSILGRECHQTLLVDVNLESATCVKLAVSKGLGIGIVLASSIVKIPQILLLLRSRSADGLSLTAYLLELTSFVIMSAYSARHGFPFSTYGETVLIAAQDVVVGLLILHYQGQDAAAATFVAGVALAVYLLLFGGGDVVGLKTLQWLQATTGLLGVASKLPQILMVWQQGSTGQLSAFVVFNFLIGSLTRIYTTVQETKDSVILYGYLVGFILNSVLAGQMLYYWNSPPQPMRTTPSRSKPKPPSTKRA